MISTRAVALLSVCVCVSLTKEKGALASKGQKGSCRVRWLGMTGKLIDVHVRLSWLGGVGLGLDGNDEKDDFECDALHSQLLSLLPVHGVKVKSFSRKAPLSRFSRM